MGRLFQARGWGFSRFAPASLSRRCPRGSFVSVSHVLCTMYLTTPYVEGAAGRQGVPPRRVSAQHNGFSSFVSSRLFYYYVCISSDGRLPDSRAANIDDLSPWAERAVAAFATASACMTSASSAGLQKVALSVAFFFIYSSCPHPPLSLPPPPRLSFSPPFSLLFPCSFLVVPLPVPPSFCCGSPLRILAAGR